MSPWPRPHFQSGEWQALVALVVLGLALLHGRAAERPADILAGADGALPAAYGQLPLHFEANAGQADPQVEFLARGKGYTLFLSAGDATFVLASPAARRERHTSPAQRRTQTLNHTPPALAAPAVLRLQLAGARLQSIAQGREALAGTVNYFTGSDARTWRTGLRTFAKIRYDQVYPGVDLVYYGNQRQLEYDFIVAAGADPKGITLKFQGADALTTDGEGNLILRLAEREVRWRKPVAYQEINGQRRAVACAYDLGAQEEVRFQVGAYDATLPLIIDPVLIYSTYLGGSGFESAEAMAVDSSGNVYVTGQTDSINFPTTNAFRSTMVGSGDVFVTKLNSNGTALVYSTYIGGTNSDVGLGIAVDASGNAYLTGSTDSGNFPTKNAAQTSLAAAGVPDAFVTVMSAAGTNLLYSTYFGGTNYESGNGIALGTGSLVYIVGETGSGQNFPKQSPFQPNSGGLSDAFVAKFNTALSAGSSLVYASWLGGLDDETGNAIAVDASGNVYVTGEVFSTDQVTSSFPVLNAYQSTFRGGFKDAFVTKVNAAGSAKVFSTYLGGDDADGGFGIAVDSSGNVYVAGETSSSNFPRMNAVQLARGGFGTLDAFLTKLNSAGSALLYSTYLGGNLDDSPRALAVSTNGIAAITGQTTSGNFPVTPDAFQLSFGGSADAFIALINPALTGAVSLTFSSYLGGSGSDAGLGIAVDTRLNTYLCGRTTSTNFPATAGAYQTSFGGGFNNDAFIAKFGPPVDLAVTQSSAPNPAIAGSNLTYTVVVTNLSRTFFPSVLLTNRLPAGVTFLTATSLQGSCSQAGGVVSCSLSNLTNNGGAKVTIVVTPPSPGSLTNTASIGSSQLEREYTNNTSTAITTVQGVADLTLAQLEAPDPVTVSSNLTYTITLTNRGPFTATGVTVTDVLPTGVAFVSATSPQGGCGQAAGTVTCNLNNLASNATASVTLVVRPTIEGTLTNTASVASAEFDPALANNSATVSTTVNPLVDLAVSKTGSPNPVFTGNTLTYTIVVTNRGPSTASGVLLTDTLPPAADFVSYTSSQGFCVQSGGDILCTMGNLNAGASVTITLLVKPTGQGSITNTASVTNNVADANLADNRATAVTTVTSLADLALANVGSPSVVFLNSNLTYTVTVTNLGPSPAASVTLTDTLPPGVNFLSAQPSQGSCSQSGGLVTCNLNTLAASATATVTVIVQPTVEGALTNRATATSSTPEAAPANNTAVAINSAQRIPTLNIARAGTNVVLSWLTNSTDFSLQAKTSLATTSVWNVVTNPSVVVGNENRVTNATPANRFYRLAK